MDTIDKHMQHLFNASNGLRSASRGGVYLVWTDDPRSYDNIAEALTKRTEICVRAHTFEDVCAAILDKKNIIKGLILDCPSNQAYSCSFKDVCIESVEWIRSEDPTLPLIFYTPSIACVEKIRNDNPRLSPVLKGDLDGLMVALGLDTQQGC